jgi:hypothetical protein
MRNALLLVLLLFCGVLFARHEPHYTELQFDDVYVPPYSLCERARGWELVPAVDGGLLATCNYGYYVDPYGACLWGPDAAMYHFQNDGTLDWRRFIRNEPIDDRSIEIERIVPLGDRYFAVALGGWVTVYDSAGDCLQYLVPDPGYQDLAYMEIWGLTSFRDSLLAYGAYAFNTSRYRYETGVYITDVNFLGNRSIRRGNTGLQNSSSICDLEVLQDDTWIGALGMGGFDMYYGPLDDTLGLRWQLQTTSYHNRTSILELGDGTLAIFWVNSIGNNFMYRVDATNGAVISSGPLPLEWYNNRDYYGIPSKLLKASDGSIYLFYNTTTGDVHQLSPDLQVIESWNVLPDDDFSPYDIGLGTDVVQELPNGDIALIAQRYAYDTENGEETPSPALLVIIPHAMLATEEPAVIPPSALAMEVAPNPFNPSTTISYTLVADCNVELSVYNLKGQRMGILENYYATRGRHTINVDFNSCFDSRMNSGVYLLQLKAGDRQVCTKKITLLK